MASVDNPADRAIRRAVWAIYLLGALVSLGAGIAALGTLGSSNPQNEPSWLLPVLILGVLWIVLGLIVAIASTASRTPAAQARARRQVEHARAATGTVPTIVCSYLGGDGAPLKPGARYYLAFRDDGLTVSATSAEDQTLWHSSFATDTLISIDGRGRYTTGGGYFGGGIGSTTSIAKGVAAASVLNALTTATHVDTVIHVQTPMASLFFGHDQRTPRELRIYLARFVDKLAPRPPDQAPSTNNMNQKPPSLSEELTKLAELHMSGHLNDEEYAAAKARLISGPPSS
jgi:hypothetical protein